MRNEVGAFTEGCLITVAARMRANSQAASTQLLSFAFLISRLFGGFMNSGKLSDWLQIAANIGIIAGLLLVGLQLKQNSDLLKTQLLYEESSRLVDLETQVVGETGAEVWAKSISDPENLSLAEQRIMEALLWSYVEQLRSTRLLGQLGLLEDAEWKARVRSDTGFYLGNKYGRAWWASFKEGNSVLAPDLIREIDFRLSEVDTNRTAEYIRSTMDRLREANESEN